MGKSKAKKDPSLKAELDGRSAVSKKHRKRRRSLKRYLLYYIFIAILLLGIGLVLSMTVFFKTEKIVVVGNDRYSDQKIIELSGIKTGENLVRIDKEKANESITKEFPYIESVNITRKFPSTVEINTKMVVPIAAIETNGTYAIISESAGVVELGAKEIPKGVMHIKGLDNSELSLGQKLTDSKNSSLKKLREFVTLLSETGLENIVYADFGDKHNLKLIYDHRILIEFGESIDLAYKIKKLEEVMETDDFDFDGSFEGIIDLSIDGQTRVRPCSNIKVIIGEEIPPPVLPKDELISR